jgi:hypothetical protein
MVLTLRSPKSLFALINLLLDVGVELVPGNVLGVEARHVINDLADVLISKIELQLVADSLEIVELQHLPALGIDQCKYGPAAGLIIGVTLKLTQLGTMMAVS